MNDASTQIVTIDGPAGSGKSTVARQLARRLQADYLDTGAMYRAVTYAALQEGLDLTDPAAILARLDRWRLTFEPAEQGMCVCWQGRCVDEPIRDPAVTAQVRWVADAPALRERLVAWQRTFARSCRRVVTEGRDQGTVVFPDACVKFFLIADPEERARRRWAEWKAQGREIGLDQVLQAVHERDRADRTRPVGALRQAPDALVVDTTDMTLDQVVDRLASLARARLDH